MSEKLTVPGMVLPFIIGKRGVTLKAIQDVSGANVKVPRREDETTSTTGADIEDDVVEITIDGVEAAISRAKLEINKIVDEKVSTVMNKLT
jgi:KH domain